MACYTDEDGMFLYERLEEDINNVPLNGFLEMNPDIDPASTTPFSKFGLTGTVAATASALMPRIELPPKLAQEVERIVSQARYESHSRGIVLAQYIKQYDHSRRGLVTPNQFMREFLNYFKSISTEDTALLAKAYTNSDGQVMYMAVCRDITPEVYHSHREANSTAVNNFEVGTLPSSQKHLEHGKRAASPNARLERALAAYRASDNEADKVLEQVIRFVYERRINITNIFTDFDSKLHRHRITRPQFVRGVASLGINISLAALEILAGKYIDEADPSGNDIIYRRFLEDVNNAFVLQGLEKEPLKENNTFAHTIVTSAPPRTVRPVLNNHEENFYHLAVNDILSRITRLRAYNVGASMRDFDKLGEGFITIDRFLRVLAIYDLVPVSAEERNALLKFYKGTGGKVALINYRAFLEDMKLQ